MTFKIVIFLLPLIFSCSTDAFSGDTRKGYDMTGKERSCKPIEATTVCTMVYTESDAYANKCRDAGFEAVQCACHDYICSGNINKEANSNAKKQTGYDLNGKKKSCYESKKKACTRILTPSDTYKGECIKEGLSLHTCDCHDHICKNLIGKNRSKLWKNFKIL